MRYDFNDELYWDEYVRKRERSRGKKFKCLGNEWKGEETFLSLLRKFSSPAKRALEIGCGGGRMTVHAARWFKHVYATDVSREMLRECSETVRRSNVSFHKLDGFTLEDFQDKSVDLVFSHDVFVHFSSLELYPYFRESKRILRPGGVGIVSFYNFIRDFGLFKKMSLKFWRRRAVPPPLRIHFVTEEMLRIIAADLKLKVVEMEKKRFPIAAFQKQMR